MNALYRACSSRRCSRRSGSSRSYEDTSERRPAHGTLRLLARRPLIVTFLLVGITEYYTGTRWNPGQGDRPGLRDRSPDEHHRGPRRRYAGDRPPGDRARVRHPDREPLRRALRDRRRGHGAALDDRPDRRPRRVRPGDRQRRRHRRDGRSSARKSVPSPTRSTPSATRRKRSPRATRSAGPPRSRRSVLFVPARTSCTCQGLPAFTDRHHVRPLERLGHRGALRRRAHAVFFRLGWR